MINPNPPFISDLLTSVVFQCNTWWLKDQFQIGASYAAGLIMLW